MRHQCILTFLLFMCLRTLTNDSAKVLQSFSRTIVVGEAPRIDLDFTFGGEVGASLCRQNQFAGVVLGVEIRDIACVVLDTVFWVFVR